MRCILAASLLVLVHGEQACDGSTQDCGDGDRVASGSSSKSYSSSASDAAAAEKAAKMAAMVRARDMPVTDGDDVASHPFSTSKATHRRLTAVERETFAREGYLVVRGFFQEKSVDLLRGCIERDPLILGDTASKNISVLDASGRDTRLTLWWEFGSDTIGRFSRSASLVQAASELLGGDEPFASHQKVLLKEPRTGGAWEWHQDFGYWYAQGINQPDKILSAIIAVDRNDEENGAMRILSRSHRLGRLDHGVYGGQAGADPDRVLAAMATPGHRIVTLDLEPGDVAFTHSNLLHCSRPNDSDRWRRNVIAAFNARGNEPLPVTPRMHPLYRPLEVVPDDAITQGGCIPLSSSLDFLESDTSKTTIEDNPVLAK